MPRATRARARVCAFAMGKRSKLLRKEACRGAHIENGGCDRVMSLATFEQLRRQLLPELRNRGDPPPRQLNHGDGSRDMWLANLARLLETSGGTLVRGFALYEIPLSETQWRQPAWRGTFHVVVETVLPSGKIVYTDPNAAMNEEDQNSLYIFVPSSRAHAELDDAQVLSNNWITGSVIGGNRPFCEAMVIYQKTRGRRWSVIGLTPETLVAKRNVKVKLLPYFGVWIKERGMTHDAKSLGELMGMATYDYHAEVDESDPAAAYDAVSGNAESYTSGVEGLMLEMSCRKQLLEGTMTITDVRDKFFDYFDETYGLVRHLQTEALNHRLALANF